MAFEAPRDSVPIITPASPPNRRASQRGKWRGGSAPSVSAITGSQSWIGADSRLDLEVRPALVNGAAGRVTLRDGEVFAVTGFTVRNRRIVEMDILADPERLRELDLTMLDD